MTPDPRLALVSRGDPLTPYLFRALRRRFPVAGQLSPELNQVQRGVVAARTFRLQRERWAQQFIKSPLGYALRTRNTRRRLSRLPDGHDLVFQVHGLSGVPDRPSVLYLDCTHLQSVRQWPEWNPLDGRALDRWIAAERESYQQAVHIFSFTEETRRTLVDDYGVTPGRITVTGAGVNLDTLPSLDRPAAPPPDDPVILFVGNDFRRKGGEILLEAFRLVRTVVPRARLVLVGDRPDIPDLPGVEVHGHIDDRSRIVELYAGASVFTLPSLFEPYGLVVLEAMAFGLPVVASTSSGIPDIVRHGETGLLVPVGDAPALASSLISVLTDRAMATAMGRAGRQLVEEQHTWDLVVDRMADTLAGTTPPAAGVTGTRVARAQQPGTSTEKH
ncbi:glycosyltransferase [Nakamurella sp. YIM 132087]|uniref:Glycosyltransferase n=1 Tax=Nakamurella alba TaxID=2665158 RepID=A0A7K1FI39_9ACTN|nr:glycosyltransferase family 4 protein [Nakamurella alba]MTD13750.1 glycosyltransferase [Nakamurella alba]